VDDHVTYLKSGYHFNLLLPTVKLVTTKTQNQAKNFPHLPIWYNTELLFLLPQMFPLSTSRHQNMPLQRSKLPQALSDHSPPTSSYILHDIFPNMLFSSQYFLPLAISLILLTLNFFFEILPSCILKMCL